jgi:hypothetical protein
VQQEYEWFANRFQRRVLRGSTLYDYPMAMAVLTRQEYLFPCQLLWSEYAGRGGKVDQEDEVLCLSTNSNDPNE